MRQLKHLLTLVLLVVLVCGLSAPAVAWAAATPGTAPHTARQGAGDDLAAFFPMNTLVYATFGTSAADFEMLGMMLERVQDAFPPDMLDERISLDEILDEFVGEMIDGTFLTSVRPWLGDAMALGFPSPDYLYDGNWYNDNQMPFMMVAKITDRDAVVTLVADQLPDAIQQDMGDYVLFTNDEWGFTGVVMVRDDVLVLAGTDDVLPPAEGVNEPNLTDNDYYAGTLNLLPGDAYAGVVYVDTPLLVANLLGAEYNEEPTARLILTMIVRMIGPMVVGFTNLGADTLVMDVVQPVGNTTGLEALGVDFEPLPVADPAFLEVLPADAAFVIQGTDLAQIFESALAAGQTIVDEMLGAGVVFDGELPPDALMRLNLLDVVLGNVAGFSYPRDLRPWLQGNYAMFMGLDMDFDPAKDPDAANFPIMAGAVFQVDDPDATRNFVCLLGREAQLFLRMQGVKGITINTTVVDDVDMVTVDVFDYDTHALQLAVAVNDMLIVFGTRNAVDAVLFEDGPRFVPEMPELLPEPAIVLYAAPPKLEPAAGWMDDDADPAEVEDLIALLNVIQRATISVQSLPDGGGILRATLTIGG